jgi:methylglutaconyl-CoA hydratase
MLSRLTKRVFSQTVNVKPLITENLGSGIFMFSLNRAAARNALSVQLVEDLQDAIRDNVDQARCVIVRSAIPGMFCAGADLKERKSMSEEEAREFVRELRATFNMLD